MRHILLSGRKLDLSKIYISDPFHRLFLRDVILQKELKHLTLLSMMRNTVSSERYSPITVMNMQ